MNILVTLDSSPAAQAALAATLARDWPESTTIKLLTVIPESRQDSGLTKVRRFAERIFLNQKRNELQAKFPNATVQAHVTRGDKTTRILENANAWPADLIIVPADDRVGFARFFRKSVPERVFERASCSVIIARDRTTSSSVNNGQSEYESANNVLIALDEDYVNANLLLAVAASSTWSEPAHIHVLTVVEPISYAVGTFESGMSALSSIDALEKNITTIARSTEQVRRELEWRFRSKSHHCTVSHSVEQGDAAETILDFAKRKNIDLIMVGTSGKSEFKRKLLGSVSQAVASKANCSVQIVRSSITPLTNRHTEPIPRSTLRQFVSNALSRAS